MAPLVSPIPRLNREVLLHSVQCWLWLIQRIVGDMTVPITCDFDGQHNLCQHLRNGITAGQISHQIFSSKFLIKYAMCVENGGDTVYCSYNTVNILPNPHKIHSIAHLLERDVGCLLFVWFICGLTAVMYAISCFIPCSVLILASDWLTTVKYGAVPHVLRHQHEI